MARGLHGNGWAQPDVGGRTRARGGPPGRAEEDGDVTRFRWARKTACNWLSLLTSRDLKWIPPATGTPLTVAYSPASSMRPRFPAPNVLARLELGSVLSVGGGRKP